MTGTSSPAAPAARRDVSVHWGELGGVFVEQLPAEVRDLLATACRVPAQYKAGGLGAKPVRVDLTRVQGFGAWTNVPTGFEPAVIAACRRAGYQVRVTGYVPERLPPPSPTRLIPGLPDTALLDLVRAHPGGVVRYGPTVDPVVLVAQVATAWPDMTVAVVVRRVADTLRVRDHLRELGIDASAASWRYRPCVGDVGRVVVCTPPGLSTDGVNPEWRQIVVAMDAVEMLAARDQWCFSHCARARAYGLLPAAVTPAPVERDLIAAYFGLTELTIPAHGRVERRAEVEWVTFTGGVRGRPTDDPVELYRRGIWEHRTRNARVATLARRHAALPGAAAGGVVVMVGGVDHALALLDHLAGWPVVAAGKVNTTGLSPTRITALTAATSPFSRTSSNAIVTAAAMPDLDLTGISVLVRVDAGTGLPPIRPSQLVVPADATPLRLVDLADRHHPGFRRAARARRASYTARGWYAPGVDQLAGRIDRFLATRPVLPRSAR
ncbi:MAG: hypothetical protein JWO38_3634 [Gemmataceae bacterium]|nr:hypothetical protein [Gemmataceae bacterium]